MARCPYCNSEDSIRHGKTRRTQRWRCKNCGTDFSEDANPPGNPRCAGFCLNHPDKKAYALGLCQTCYRKKRREEGKDKGKT